MVVLTIYISGNLDRQCSGNTRSELPDVYQRALALPAPVMLAGTEKVDKSPL